MLKRIGVAGIASLALGLLLAASADAADPAAAGLDIKQKGTGELPIHQAEFEFTPKGERVSVFDANANDWDVLLELWWGGKLQRWCWNTKGGLETQNCDFEIKEGQNITFFLTEFRKSQWDQCAPSAGCGKRQHFWASHSGNDGCRATGQRAPCGFGVGATPNINDPADFLGEA